MPIRDNQYVIASGLAARGYAKFILDGNLPGALEDFFKAAHEAGFDNLIQGVEEGIRTYKVQSGLINKDQAVS